MDHEGVDSRSSHDENTKSENHRVLAEGHLAGKSRPFISSAPNRRMQGDMELEIHNLERAAYGSVLRALMGQSDALTWEKESIITELRKELRVSDDEHRELLAEVNSDNRVRIISDWRKGIHLRNVANQAASPTVSAHHANYIIPVSQNPFGAPSPLLGPYSVAVGTQPLIVSTLKRGPPSGNFGPRTNAPAFIPSKHIQYVSPGDLMDASSERNHDTFIGRKVMRRCPADNKFYEAFISQYNHLNGRHSLVYNSNTPNATVEWVDMKEVSPEDISWVGNGSTTSQLVEIGTSSRWGRPSLNNRFANEIQKGLKQDPIETEVCHTRSLIKKVEKVISASDDPITSQLRETGASSRRGRPPSKNRVANEIKRDLKQDSDGNEMSHTRSLIKKVEKVLSATDVHVTPQLCETGAGPKRRGRPPSKNRFANEIRKCLKKNSDEIEIYNTRSLITKVEKVLDSSNPNELELDKAMELLKEQEQSLVHAIEKLTDACNDVGARPPAPEQPVMNQEGVEAEQISN